MSVQESVTEQTCRAAGGGHNWTVEKTTNKNTKKQHEGERDKLNNKTELTCNCPQVHSE